MDNISGKSCYCYVLIICSYMTVVNNVITMNKYIRIVMKYLAIKCVSRPPVAVSVIFTGFTADLPISSFYCTTDSKIIAPVI